MLLKFLSAKESCTSITKIQFMSYQISTSTRDDIQTQTSPKYNKQGVGDVEIMTSYSNMQGTKDTANTLYSINTIKWSHPHSKSNHCVFYVQILKI